MTVAAVILSASADGAVADADGLPSVRRIADAAWSGGAVPIVVVSFDPSGDVATALTGAPVTLAEPAPEDRARPARWRRGIDVARGEVRDLTGVLIWPARLVWVGPETVTSLIEAHGTAQGAVLAPITRASQAGRSCFLSRRSTPCWRSARSGCRRRSSTTSSPPASASATSTWATRA